MGQPAQTTVAAYAPLLIVEPRKDAPGQLHAFLRANPLAVPAFFKSILTDDDDLFAYSFSFSVSCQLVACRRGEFGHNI